MKITVCLFFMLAPFVAAASSDLLSLQRAGLIAPEVVRTHLAEFGFTPDQEARLRTLAEESKPRLAELQAVVKTEQQKLEAVVRSEDAKAEDSAAQLDKLLAAESALKHEQLDKLLELRSLLTPEQRTLAQALARKESQAREPVEERVKHKAESLKAAWDEIGIEPPESLRAKGEAVQGLVRDGRQEEADKALDVLIEEVGLNVQISATPVDFAQFDPGNTDLGTLKERYDSIVSRAKLVTSLPTLRQLLKGREALEKAKAAEDVELVARIITWAEGVLPKEP